MSSLRPKLRPALLALVLFEALWMGVSPGGPRSLMAADGEVAAVSRGHETAARHAAEKSLRLAIPSRLRVGLATDLEALVLPCCDGD
ncbi:MAG: hypothetical protein WBO74_03925, partial [Thermoanaerobaculia bacterium]